MGIICTKGIIHDHMFLVCTVVTVCVLQKDQIRCLSYDGSSFYQGDAGGKRLVFRKSYEPVCTIIAVRILADRDPVGAGFLTNMIVWIIRRLDDP